MIELLNPYRSLEGYRCFGCSPDNASGLRMRFWLDGDEVVSRWLPEPRFAGYGTVLHGGVQATLHDEIASWVVLVVMGTAGWTKSLGMEYAKPVPTDAGELVLRSRLAGIDGNLASIETVLSCPDGETGSLSKAVYFTVREPIARKKFYYPGKDAFFAAP